MSDIVLNDNAFEKAVNDFDELKNRMERLIKSMDTMLEDLSAGFKSTAGDKFISSCRNNLYKPLKDQKAIIEHILQTLRDVKKEYSSVFAEYNELKSLMNSVK